MSQPTEQRPPQVTLASGIIMFASFIVLATAWEQVATLGSLDTQQAIRDILAEAPFSSLGIDVENAAQLLRVTCMVAAACACATAILGWFVRKPDRSSRLALTIFAGPVFVTGLAVGGLAGSFVAAGTAMLWLAPAREWFATGRWTPPASAADKQARSRTSPGAPRGTDGRLDPPSTGSTTPPPATRPFGEHRLPGEHAGLGGQPPTRPEALAATRQQLLHARPPAMVAAFVITVVTAGGLLALSLLWLAMAGLSPEFLMSVLEQQQPGMVDDGLTLEEVRETVYAYASVFIVWCLLALVLAGFAMARRDWARRGLMVTAAFSAAVCLVFVVSTPLVLIPAAAAVATVVCLRRIEVRRWFSPEAH